ncbi:E3 ubiquitin-protein ligase ZNRF1 isoform X2 [Aricia agestis]|uniref:E3 ubiquitin-protein ligase ZNRF1 isoform X2 n=1 Tax=Aricia agestis TaxID=91739 RepID=UPI001C209573|nr:E3 ubiquitin-protein ligase ZNRF1 isoform X2 [Aricia agestis]
MYRRRYRTTLGLGLTSSFSTNFSTTLSFSSRPDPVRSSRTPDVRIRSDVRSDARATAAKLKSKYESTGTAQGIKCPVCSKFVLPDDIECHLVMCLTRPRLSYNEDVLSECKGECVICLEELTAGDTIARLPCLCIYHKGCIDQWFEVNRSCPEHPGD